MSVASWFIVPFPKRFARPEAVILRKPTYGGPASLEQQLHTFDYW